MTGTPGILFGEFTLPGLVLDPIEWGVWDLHCQRTKVSGLQGETSMNTLPGGRDIVLQMMVWDSIPSEAALMALLGSVDELAGNVEGLGIYDPNGDLRFQLQLCELAPLKLHMHRWDGTHGWWAKISLPFRQLSSSMPAVEEPDGEDESEEEGEDDGP